MPKPKPCHLLLYSTAACGHVQAGLELNETNGREKKRSCFQPRGRLYPCCSWIPNGFLDSFEQDCEQAQLPAQNYEEPEKVLADVRASVLYF